MPVSLLLAFDGSSAAGAAGPPAGALFPGAHRTVLTVHEPAVRPATTFRVGGGLISPEVVQQSLSELERELVGEAEAVAAEGVRLAGEAGLTAEPAVAAALPQRLEPILATAR